MSIALKASAIGVLFQTLCCLASDPKEWTLMIYAAADEGTEIESELEKPVIEMLRGLEQMPVLGKQPSRVNIVVQLDRPGPDMNYRYLLQYQPTPTGRLELDSSPIPESDIEAIDSGFDYAEKDSASPVTLKNFVSWAVEAYPANHYALFLSGHSWDLVGIMQDFHTVEGNLEVSRMMMLYELARVLREVYMEKSKFIPNRIFELLFVDACIVGQVHSALEFPSDTVQYFAASTLETPINSMPLDTILSGFIEAVNSSSNAAQIDLLENYLLKPLVKKFVESHARERKGRPWGGELAKREREIDATEAFAIRTEGLENVALAIRNLISDMPEEVRQNWLEGRLRRIDAIRDVDGNADMLLLAQAFNDYFRYKLGQTKRLSGDTEKWQRVINRAVELENSLGYPVLDDPTAVPISITSQTAQGAWVHIQGDELVPSREAAACLGLKTFTMLNGLRYSVVPTFLKDGKELDMQALDCHEFAKQDPSDGAETDSGTPVPIESLWNIEVRWPHGVAAYMTDSLDSKDKSKIFKRYLSIWVSRGKAKRLRHKLYLRFPSTEKIIIDYVPKGDPVQFIMQLKSLESRRKFRKIYSIPPFYYVDDSAKLQVNGKPGLYVAEAHSAFKFGLGIYLKRSFPAWAEEPYHGGYLPIEKAKELSMLPLGMDRLEQYFVHLENLKLRHLHYPFIRTGVDFFKLHKIQTTGWPEFLFGK